MFTTEYGLCCGCNAVVIAFTPTGWAKKLMANLLIRNIPLFGHPVGVKALVRDAATARIGLY